jgi:hypothetical protein
VYEFIEAKYGAEGVRQFLFALRKSVIGGGEDAYEEALRMKPDEFDQAFERYLKDRFKAFRDKERSADYGRDLAPNQEKTHYTQALSIAPSPSGDLVATATGNRKDGELDIVLLSSKDGSIVRNLTQGFDKNYKFDHIVSPGGYVAAPWMSWSPKGDRLAYFVRTEKERTLIIQNVLTRKIETRVAMKTVDEPESPSFAPDGRTLAFSAMRGGIRDIYTVNLDNMEVANLTTDDFFDYGPTYSPDGKFLVYTARVSGNQKLFRLDLGTKQKKQLSFGTNDETPAQFVDEHTLVFSSTATDPSVALDPEVAKNGNIYNLWTLDLNNGELKQYTDALGGVFSPIVLKDSAANRIAFVSYYKGDFSIHTLERKEPIHTAASADFGAPGPIIDFQAPLQHTLVSSNQRRKKSFEKMFLEGRPPVNVASPTTATSSAAPKSALATCSATSRSTCSRPRSPSIERCRSATSTWARAFSTPCRATRRPSSSTATSKASSTIRRWLRSSAVMPRSRRARCAAAAPSASIRSTGSAGSSSRAAWSTCRSSTTIRSCSNQPSSSRRSGSASRSSATAR